MQDKISEEYDKIIKENAKFLKKWVLDTREKKVNILKNIMITIGIIYLWLLCILFMAVGNFIFIIIFFIITLKKIYDWNQKTEIYQEKVVKPLIKRLEFVDEVNMKNGISQTIYNQANFKDSQYEKYYKWHYITGHLNNAKIEMSKVRTYNQYKDSEGHVTTKTIFRGLLVVATLNTNVTNENIHIFNDKDDSRILNFKQSEEKVNMDSAMFEKQFDVYSTNPIKAFQILTADIMEKLILEKENMNCQYDISIINNMIIMRIHDKGDIFEIRHLDGKNKTIYGKDLKKTIVEDVKFVEYILNFMNELSNNIYNKI